MFKKIFNPKRKRQDPGRHNTNKITFDPASAAILYRHFSPLSSMAKSPSDVLDIVGYPLIQNNDYNPFFSPLPSESPFTAIDQTPEATSPAPQQRYRLTIRNNTTPSPSPNQQSILLLETSREDKTLVESNHGLDENTTSREIYRLQQKLKKLEQEKEAWDLKLQGYIEREEQMRELIYQLQRPTRHNSYRTISTQSTLATEEEEEEDEQENQELQIYDEYPYSSYYNHPCYPYDYYYKRSWPSSHYYYYD